MCEPGGPGMCIDDTTYSGRDGTGVCMQGVCVYSSMETTCSSCTDGTCVGAASCADGCTNPPAPSCKADGTTLVSYAPVGTCSAGSCTYTPINTYCTAGCFDGACLPGSSYEVLPVTNGTSTNRTLRMALDGNDRVYVAEQQGGTVQLYKRGAVGWYRINIEAGSDLSLAVRADGTAYVAYIGASSTPRLATIAPDDTVSLSLVSLNASAAPSVAIDTAGKPVVAYVDTLASPDQLRVAVPGTSPWTSEAATSVGGAWSGMMTSVAVNADGALHVLAGSRGERAASYTTAIYAHKPAGGSWTANTNALVGALTSPSSPMILDDNGDALVFYHAVGIPSYTAAGPSNYALMARFSPGQAPVKEVLGTASNEDPPRAVRYWDDSIGAVNLSGYSWHRSAENLWYATGTTVAAIDVAVGLDGALRTIVNRNYSWQVVTESCPRLALGNCGSDQCGGSVGECGECDVCDSETRYCSEFSSERRDLYNPTVQHVARLTSGDFYVGLGQGESIIGDTGSWSPGPSGQLGTLYRSPNGEHLFRISTNIIERWNGSTWVLSGSTLTSAAYTVSNSGVVHAMRRKQDTVIHDIEYLTLTGTTWSAPETAFQHPLGIAYQGSLVVDESDGSVHSIVSACAYDWQGGGCSYIQRVRAPSGSWSNGTGLSTQLTEYAVTPDGTIWAKYSCTVPTRYFYAYKPPGGAWVSEGCANPGTMRMPDGKFLVDPGGTIQVVRQEYADATYTRQQNIIYEIDANTGTFEAVREAPAGLVAYDELGDLHTFNTESVSGIQRFRHYFMP